uniref:FCP1 homology domain-containing protein n=1 Tax=viral metagenome TaxID=1070528 RepID=A0A6M3IP08_9ZZZZ
MNDVDSCLSALRWASEILHDMVDSEAVECAKACRKALEARPVSSAEDLSHPLDPLSPGGPVLAVDLDGTILEHNGWVGEDHFGAVLPGAVAELEELRRQGWKIVVYTCRDHPHLVESYLSEQGVPFDLVWSRAAVAAGGRAKPIADVLLDDRAVTFAGDWRQAVHDVLAFRPWGGA